MLRENWYAVHVLSQYENKVKSYIDKVKKEHGYEDKVSEVVIPVDTEVKRVNGKKVEKKNKVFPGYILIRMKLDDDSYNHRKNILVNLHLSKFISSDITLKTRST